MKILNLLSIKEACELLSISRPTFDKFRKKYSLKNYNYKGRILFSKLEIFEKILSPETIMPKKRIKVSTFSTDESLDPLFLSKDIIDLRGEISLDAFGVISLLCKLKDLIKNEDSNIFVLVENNSFCRYLKSIGFFSELKRSNDNQVIINSRKLNDVPSNYFSGTTILPLHLLGYRGAEKKVVVDLYDALITQGFSESLSGYLGWVIGELADNCHTHAKGGVCYLMIDSMHNEKIPYKFLSLVIGDIGQGIPVTLKTNPKYEQLSDIKAFVTAFKSNVSSWLDKHGRGKGLNDIFGIGIGNRSIIRVESNNSAFFASFLYKEQKINLCNSVTNTRGTRLTLILIDNIFKDISRKETDEVITKFLETL